MNFASASRYEDDLDTPEVLIGVVGIIEQGFEEK